MRDRVLQLQSGAGAHGPQGEHFVVGGAAVGGVVQGLQQRHLQLVAHDRDAQHGVTQRVLAQDIGAAHLQGHHAAVDGAQGGGHFAGGCAQELQAERAAGGDSAAIGPGGGADAEKRAQATGEGGDLASDGAAGVVIDGCIGGLTGGVAVGGAGGLVQVQSQGSGCAGVAGDGEGGAVVFENDGQR